MAHILHIDASPRGDRSVSRSLTHDFISGWKAAHPEDTVTYRDLGHNPVPLVTEAWIAAAFSPPENHTPEMQAAIAPSNELIDELLAADRYVFGIPMYNFSIPASFKAYIDQVVRAGRTFSVSDAGYKGLVEGRKALILVAAGGQYRIGTPAGDYNFLEPYMKTILGFIGITDVNFIYADGRSQSEEVQQKAMAEAHEAIQTAIGSW